MHNELLCLLVESGSSLDTVQVGAMRQFRLGVATSDLPLTSWFVEQLLLFFGTQILDSGHEHLVVEGRNQLIVAIKCLQLLGRST